MSASRTVVALALLGWAAAAAPAALAPPPRADAPHASAELEAALAAHGEWLTSRAHGRAWRPRGVPAGWRPYLHGEWTWSADGWLWTTDEPWGEATYHYGRWAWDAELGWCWVPGGTWAPAWVAWRYGGGFAGWAPLFPGVDAWWVRPFPIDVGYWVFVPMDRLVGAPVDRALVEPGRVPLLLRSTRPAPPPGRAPRADAAPAAPGGGPPVAVVERAVGRPLAPARQGRDGLPPSSRH
jgi:uncharacterized protein DUF6600